MSWSKSYTESNLVNNNAEFEPNDAVTATDINACFNNAFYAVDFVRGISAEGGANIASVGTPSVNFDINTKKFTFNYLKGQTGADGGRWYSGTGITGTSATATVFSGSGVSSAVVGDMYLNTSTYNTYRCTLGGNASTAKWVYSCNIRGAQGIAAGFGTPTATATTKNANQSATASVSADSQSPDTSKVFAFTFGIPKGTTFTPSVAANGDLSWTNDGGKTNPSTVNIKGPKGDAATVNGSTANNLTFSLVNNVLTITVSNT